MVASFTDMPRLIDLHKNTGRAKRSRSRRMEDRLISKVSVLQQSTTKHAFRELRLGLIHWRCFARLHQTVS